MRRAVWTEDGIDVVDDEPGPLAPGWVRLRVEACGICGSDLHFLHGQVPRPLGTSPGHELAGLWRRQLPPDLQWAAVATPREGWLWSEGGGSADHGTPALLDRAVPVVFWGVGVPARRCDAVVRTVDIAPTLAALLRVAPTEPLDGTAVPLDRCGRPGR